MNRRRFLTAAAALFAIPFLGLPALPERVNLRYWRNGDLWTVMSTGEVFLVSDAKKKNLVRGIAGTPFKPIPYGDVPFYIGNGAPI